MNFALGQHEDSPLEGGGGSGAPYPGRHPLSGGLLSGRWLAEVVAATLSPVEMSQVRGTDAAPLPSYGLGPAGYDVRVADVGITNRFVLENNVIDPMEVRLYYSWGWSRDERQRRFALIDPGMAVQAQTVESFTIPDDILILPVGKSTYTRVGLQLLATPFEPGWRGRAVVSLVNTAAQPVKFYIDGGAFQCLFFHVPDATAYDGRYQDQLTGAGG